MVGPRVRTYLRFVGANVYRWRSRRDLTQEQFAELAGLDVRFVRRVERGTVNLRFDTLVRLADALGVEPGVLLRRAKLVAPKTGRPRKRTAR
jgi:transcriptional regulator with XRE-family HTH domain